MQGENLAVGLKSVHAVGCLVDYGLQFSCNLLTSVNAGGLVFSFRQAMSLVNDSINQKFINQVYFRLFTVQLLILLYLP